MDSRYYQYYDLMFSQHDYAGEVDAILRLCPDARSVYDIGCGTGNHALEFQRRGLSVRADDTDPYMVAAASAKGIAIGKPLEPVDLVAALFHVANYALDLPALLALFGEVHKALRIGGTFAFDTWDAILARDDPPMPHRYDHTPDWLRVERETLPIQILDDDAVRVINHTTISAIDSKGDKRGHVFDWEYTHRLWTPAVIRDCLDMAGFSSNEPPRKWGKRSVLYVAVK